MEIIAKYFSDFTPSQLEQLEALHALYNDWNQKINVISRKDMEHFYLHHVLHSLSIATAFDFKSGTTVLDLGCGGGFPGVPLAIFFPEVSFLMVDSIRKKLSVIEAVAQSIGLNNIAVRHTRVEDIKDRRFENIVSRAVAPLGDLWRWSKPLLKRYQQVKEDQPNGLICLKGGDLTKEIQESTCKPYIWEINNIFKEQHFQEKFMLYQPLI